MQQTDIADYKYTNHLIHENSPYLLSHAHNPVNWYPWGEEALAKAKAEDKPIFLSIGYAACHWCHVMERESFENEEIAAILNENFISIKVDREQRPDLDHIYMSFTTALTGHGGWPMSAFLTSDLKPFFAGTYFPPDDRYGRPGFKRILTEIAATYRDNKQAIYESSNKIFQEVQQYLTRQVAGSGNLNADILASSAKALMRGFDDIYGGFGDAPKFPHATELSLFLRYYHASTNNRYLQAAEKALTAMAHGGIYDHIGGGFARYSTDQKWLVPHFEKMLYDNGLLVPVYVEAYQITGKPLYLNVIRETLDFILRAMTDKTGGFYSSLDADSEGEEGKFYLWEKKEIDAVLGDESELFCEYYNVSKLGNFEEKNILHITSYSDKVKQEAGRKDFDRFIKRCRQKLLDARSKRVRPLTDDKILTSWNGLALTALCKGYQVTDDMRYLDAARNNAEFVQSTLFTHNALTHSYREGGHSDGEFLEDYAYYIRGLLDLYETDIENSSRWITFASKLADKAVTLFMDDNGIFYLRPADNSDLIIRPKEETDGALPAAGSFMISNLFKLHRITDNSAYLKAGEKALQAVSGKIAQYPGNMASAVLAADYYLHDKIEVVIVGDGSERATMIQEVYRRYLPNTILAVSIDGSSKLPLFEDRYTPGEVRAFVCRNSVCQLPVSTKEDLQKQLDAL